VIAMSKKQKRGTKTAPKKSEIIKQCVIYLQCKAAFDAGFAADTTGDGIFAGRGKNGLGIRPFNDAEKAIRRLIALSPIHGNQPTLTIEELKAKAAVCRVMELESDDLTPNERTYVRFFVREVESYLATVAS
jgi:hypothetical protein